MKRFLRRSIAIIVGVSLGWYVAGQLNNRGYAAPEERPVATRPAEEARPTSRPTEAAAERGETAETVEGGEAAEKLVPPRSDASFMKPVLAGAAGLFLAAVTLGWLALKVRGPEPVEVVAHDDEHQQHFEPGHDPSEHPTKGVLEAEKHDHGHGH